MNNYMRLFLATVVLTIIIYATMLFWTLPIITEQAGGLLVFDLRPAGYSFEEAHAFLTALSDEGKVVYSGIQHKLDTAFPLLSAISTGGAIYLLAGPGYGKFRIVLALLAVPGMVFDYLENAAVANMLQVGAQGISESMVAIASFNSQMKAATVTMAMVVLLFFITKWCIGWWRGSR